MRVSAERAAHPFDGGLSVRRDDHELGEHRVVVARDDAPLLDPGVDAHARTVGGTPQRDLAGSWRE